MSFRAAHDGRIALLFPLPRPGLRAIVTGAAGQDGTLLRRLLCAQGAEVLGLVRDAHKCAAGDGELIETDVTDAPNLSRTIRDFRPDHVYHLAAHHRSSEQTTPVALERAMVETNFVAVQTLAQTIIDHVPGCRLLVAGSSQMYTAVRGRIVVDETTPMCPSSFYGWTKAWSRQLLDYAREKHGLFGVTAILFNHESTRRAPTFVTRKITMAAARARHYGTCDLHLKDIGAAADWMSAEDAVAAMVAALSGPAAQDYVIASGVVHTVKDILEVAFGSVGLDWREFTRFDRASSGEPAVLVGNTHRIDGVLKGPRRDFAQLISEMTAFDLEHGRGAI